MEFVRTSKVGSSAFVAQRCSNSYGWFSAVEEYGGVGRRGFIVLSKGQEGKGWRNCVVDVPFHNL
jgi:hypothetical protein